MSVNSSKTSWGDRDGQDLHVDAQPEFAGKSLSRGLKKGLAIIYLKDFVAERFGTAAWDELVATFPDADREALSSAVSTEWYDLALHARLNREFCNRFRRGSLTIAQELGRFSAEQDVNAHLLLFRFMKPSFVLRHMNLYWRRSDDT